MEHGVTGTLNPTGSGIVEIDASSGGAHNFNAGSTVTGDGTFQIANGIVNFNDTHPSHQRSSSANGTINVFATVNANGPFNWNARHPGEHGNAERQRYGHVRNIFNPHH